MNWILIGLNWTVLLNCLEMTFVVIWRFINKTELNWNWLQKKEKLHLTVYFTFRIQIEVLSKIHLFFNNKFVSNCLRVKLWMFWSAPSLKPPASAVVFYLSCSTQGEVFPTQVCNYSCCQSIAKHVDHGPKPVTADAERTLSDPGIGLPIWRHFHLITTLTYRIQSMATMSVMSSGGRPTEVSTITIVTSPAWGMPAAPMLAAVAVMLENTGRVKFHQSGKQNIYADGGLVVWHLTWIKYTQSDLKRTLKRSGCYSNATTRPHDYKTNNF